MAGRPTRWTWIWLAALAVVVSGELFTVVDPKHGDTISENVQLLTLARSPWVKWPARVVIVGLCGWLAVHLSLGIWP